MTRLAAHGTMTSSVKFIKVLHRMTAVNEKYMALLNASIADIKKEIARLQGLPTSKDKSWEQFWLHRSSSKIPEPKPASDAELEAHRNVETTRLNYARLATTFSQHMQDLEQQLHEEALKIGVHAEAAVRTDAPSRCGRGDFTLTELQRAAQRFFQPGCPPPMRRIMTELTPGMGKTCIYMEVIAKFMGRRNPDTGDFFDIIILGDDEVFSAFDKLRDCPASVNLEEIVEWNEEIVTGDIHSTVLYRNNDPSMKLSTRGEPLKLKDINRGKKKDIPSCALNTDLQKKYAGKLESSAESYEASAEKKGTSLGSKDEDVGVPKKKDKDATPLEEQKSLKKCEDDAWVWRGTRVIMIPYAVAAKWVVYSGKGVPLWDKNGKRIRSKSDATAGAYVDIHGKKEHFQPTELGTGFGGLVGALRETPSIYKPKGLNFDSSNTLFIIDEVQNISIPSTWGKGHEARPYSPALSEALWRSTGDFCYERDDDAAKTSKSKPAENLPSCPPGVEGIKKTPYIFAGTATPNTGTNPESTICLLQILNGKQRAELFVPQWADDGSNILKKRTLQDYRALLRSGDKRFTKELVWPSYPERHAKDLIVYPRAFLEKESGFVEEVTTGEKGSERFPLLAPQTQKGVVEKWKYNKSKYSYAEAAKKVLKEKLLPQASKDVTKEPTYVPHNLQKGKLLTHELAYKSFVCAAREEDLERQFTRIYKPVYSDDLNRLFLQDMVATRVFTANSYFDYRVYPQVDPTRMADMATPLTRIVQPEYALRCLPRDENDKGSFKPNRAVEVVALRLLDEKRYPVAIVFTKSGPKKQYPWFVPQGAAEKFETLLKTNLHPHKKTAHADYDDLRWSELSLCADPAGMKTLCRKLLASYRADKDVVDLDLENELRDFCAETCPKLVVAADDLYNCPDAAANILLASEAKTFFFMNAQSRKNLNSNYFIVLASFYFRMRCRPYLQARFKDHNDKLPSRYQKDGRTIQHRIAWLDALLLQEGHDASLEKFPPWNVHGTSDKTAPDRVLWQKFWENWMQGHRANRGIFPIDKECSSQGTEVTKTTPPSPFLFESGPLAGKAAEDLRQRLHRSEKRAVRAEQKLKALKEEPEEDRDKEAIRGLETQARKPLLVAYKKQYGERQRQKQTLAQQAYYIPAIFALGDSEMDYRVEQDLHFKLYCNIMKNLSRSNPSLPKSWVSDHEKSCEGGGLKAEKKKKSAKATDIKGELSAEEIVLLMGSPGLRLAMTKAMGCEPCVLQSCGAGQSMVFAGIAAHKALDFKCTGLNVAFGPQPRGQRIQEMGRNWRTCVNIPKVAIRQIFLDGKADILKNDLLLDSFYQAQNEVLEWLRIITVSASLGCSLWWGYSQWAKLLNSYHELRPQETRWFFGADARPCLDARGSSGKPSLLTWHQRQEQGAIAGFWRCRRTNVTSVARLADTTNVGEIVPSPVGAFSPDEIVFDSQGPHKEDVVPDPSCKGGSAVELHETFKSASIKYCLTRRESLALQRTAPPPLKIEHLAGPKEEHVRIAQEQQKRPKKHEGVAPSHGSAIEEAVRPRSQGSHDSEKPHAPETRTTPLWEVPSMSPKPSSHRIVASAMQSSPRLVPRAAAATPKDRENLGGTPSRKRQDVSKSSILEAPRRPHSAFSMPAAPMRKNSKPSTG